MSMNFTAWAYWTDGWRDRSLMPNDEGLRRCTCGQFYLLMDMQAIEKGAAADNEDLPFTMTVPDEHLPECFTTTVSAQVEVAARLGYWRYLNHDYRRAYVKHRDAEEAATRGGMDREQPRSAHLVGPLAQAFSAHVQQARGQPLYPSAL